jgi:2-keto-3-deoxy-L-rhamnonate aldolase RhmA
LDYGDLIAIMMVETAEGLRNVNETAAEPGVGGFYIGPSELSHSLGVAPDSAETEAAIQTVLEACLAHNVPCGITAGEADMPRRVEAGFRILGGGGVVGGLSVPIDAAIRAGRAAANSQ